MSKINVRFINCVCWGKRGDKIGSKSYINRMTSEDLVNKVNMLLENKKKAVLYDYLCQKCKIKTLWSSLRENDFDNYVFDNDSGIQNTCFEKERLLDQNEIDNDTDTDSDKFDKYEDNRLDTDKKEANFHKSPEKESKCLGNEIYVDIARSATSHGNCIICKKSNTYQKLKQISKEAIVVAFCETKILIPFGTRACSTHFDGAYNIKLQDLNEIEIYKTNTKLNSKQVEDALWI